MDTTKEEVINSETEETVQKRPFNKKIAIIAVASVIFVYLIGALYFNSHFFPFTKINNVDCAFLSVEDAKKKIADTVEKYTYTIETEDGSEEIKGSDIDLKCSEIKDAEKLKANQNPFMWLFDTKNRDVRADVEITYNEDKLFYKLEWLDCAVGLREILSTVPSKVAYTDGVYSIGEYGNKTTFDFGAVFAKARLDVYELKNKISLEEFYVPASEHPQVRAALDKMNLMVSANITYQRGEKVFVLDESIINGWVSIGNDYTVYLDTPKVAEYVKMLSQTYDTVGTEREFMTSKGEIVKVKGGNYGWRVNQKAETADLSDLIITGQTVARVPVYAQTAAAQGDKCDIYNTYVEISLASQQLWFYKNGELIINTPIVTGNPYAGNATPPGIFYVVYKTRNAILRGADYETPVSYWMPFNGGIGLHDATWRGVFGGSIYRGGGSHGCINLPFSAAAKIYQNISAGDPVVVY